MKRDFTNENFERFLKQSADNLRMKAPERVWQNLSKELNRRRRRFIFGISAFLIIGSALTTGFFISSNDLKQPSIVSQNQEQPSASSLKNEPITQESSTSKVTSFLLQPETSFNTGNSPVQTVAKTQLVSFNSTGIGEKKIAEPTNLTVVNSSELFHLENNFTATIVDSYSEFDDQQTTDKKEHKQSDLTLSPALPLTIESVLNTYKPKSKRKLEMQLYFSPTISYRKLSENKSYLRTLAPANIPANFPAFKSSVNNNVTHKPDVGFELGFAAKIPISNKLKLRSGIQFNVNRYDVKAFSSPLSIATIALNNGPTTSSLNTISGYSNVQGYKSNWLQNFSFQVSAPVGIEYNFSNAENVQFGMATTIQPTYVLGDRAYLITTDYKNYTQVPWLIRRWNVNTSLEAFVKYKSWQFGPQVRYQLLSSFISKYPVKENLFDFGLKVGVSLK